MNKVDNWAHYGYNANPLFPGDAQACIDIMTNLGHVGLSQQYITDFQHFTAAQLMNKVNNAVPPDTTNGNDLPAGPWTGNYNWMRVTIGRRADNTPIVVILYHLLRHRIVTAEPACWSWSVGFVPTLLTDLPAGGMPAGSAAKQEYVDFAAEIATVARFNLMKDTYFKPSGMSSVIYDQIDHGDPNNTPGSNEHGRRKTKIGELGWVFQKDTTQIPTLFTIQKSKKYGPPKDFGGNQIKGWARTPGEQIITTQLDIKV